MVPAGARIQASRNGGLVIVLVFPGADEPSHSPTTDSNHVHAPQNATLSLTGLQLQAIELLLRGETVTAVAATIGVSRETVHRWLKDDLVFVAAINAGKAELQQAATARLIGVWAKAADNVAQAVERGNLKASLIVLRGFGGIGLAPP